MKKIACCTDFSANADVAFEMALDLAERYNARLYVIHVVPPAIPPVCADMDWAMPEQPRDTLISQATDRLTAIFPPRIDNRVAHELVVLDGHVSSQIIGFLDTTPMDVLVLGSYGLSGVGLVIFGSVAKRLAHKAPCSVLIARVQD